jgi:hypothetical protein
MMIWQVVVVFFTSSVKFLFAPGISLGLGFTAVETFIITTTGGCFGICLFYFLSERLMQGAIARRQRLVKEGKAKKKKNFTRVNKAIVKIKRTLGVMGIVYITLPFISIPLCAIISAKFFRHRRSTIALLLSSVVIWSILITWVGSLWN